MSFPRVPQDRLSLTQGATQLKNLIEWKHILVWASSVSMKLEKKSGVKLDLASYFRELYT